MESIDKVKKYLSEEKIDEESGMERGEKTLKCPSCGMTNFVHAGGQCGLGIWRFILTK